MSKNNNMSIDYAHALATARKEYFFAQTDSTRNVLRTIFPELAEVSTSRLDLVQYLKNLKKVDNNGIAFSDEVIDKWINDLTQEPIGHNWKPQLNQMASLKKAIENYKGYTIGDDLESLYDDLTQFEDKKS